MGKHWEVELDVVEKCSKGPSKKIVWISRLAKLKVDLLMKKFKDQEWLAYLIGEDFRVTDLFIPEQAASHAHVGKIECEEYNKLRVIGVMHSHHSMGSGFSSTDHDFINSNHNISILANLTGRSYQLTGQARVEVPCGALFIAPADVRLDLEVDGFDKKLFMEEIDKKVNHPKETNCTDSVCYCGNCFPSQTRFTTSIGNEPPAHMKTFPMHSSGCRCSGCIRDRNEWNQKQQQSRGWDTKNASGTGTAVDFITDGAWICEECDKINYESKDEKIEDCVWCDTPRNKEEGVWDSPKKEGEEPVETLDAIIDDIKDELDELNSLLDIDKDNKTQFISKKYADIMDDLIDEQILDKAIKKVAKYLLLVKKIDEGEYKGDLDHFVGTLSRDYDEEEDKLSDEIESIILELEDQLEEKNIEK